MSARPQVAIPFITPNWGTKSLLETSCPGTSKLCVPTLCGRLGIDTAVGDVRDLSEFRDESFDVVLCLGPLYHIGELTQRKKCISECLRVLRRGGILAAAYISKFFVFAHMVSRESDYLCDERVCMKYS